MNSPETDQTTGQKARALLKTLQETFPVFRDYSALAIGVDKLLLTQQPDLERKVLRLALGMHTNSARYLKTMERARHRVDLAGNIVAEVPEEHRKHASEVIRERFKKDAERRKALREAEALEKQRAAIENQRAEKLSQLVEKFGKK
jgi:ProP effector